MKRSFANKNIITSQPGVLFPSALGGHQFAGTIEDHESRDVAHAELSAEFALYCAVSERQSEPWHAFEVGLKLRPVSVRRQKYDFYIFVRGCIQRVLLGKHGSEVATRAAPVRRKVKHDKLFVGKRCRCVHWASGGSQLGAEKIGERGHGVVLMVRGFRVERHVSV